MKKKNFFNKQSDLTAVKIEFYKEYIERYLAILLMGFNECFVADLFCGTGKNGNKKGSPLVLIEKANYILTISKLINAKIQVLFNDKNKNCIENLKKELKNIEIDKRIKIFEPKNEEFINIYKKIMEAKKKDGTPKFFFLD